MNTLRTDHGALEMDNRARYRELLIASQKSKEQLYCNSKSPGALIDLVDTAQLVIFAGGMLALIGYGLMWILG